MLVRIRTELSAPTGDRGEIPSDQVKTWRTNAEATLSAQWYKSTQASLNSVKGGADSQWEKNPVLGGGLPAGSITKVGFAGHTTKTTDRVCDCCCMLLHAAAGGAGGHSLNR